MVIRDYGKGNEAWTAESGAVARRIDLVVSLPANCLGL